MTQLVLDAAGVRLDADVTVPDGATGVVLFAHGSGSSRHSPRNMFVAGELNRRGLATVLLDLLTPDEDRADAVDGRLRFDIGLLADRLIGAIDCLDEVPLSGPPSRTVPDLAGDDSTGGRVDEPARRELSSPSGLTSTEAHARGTSPGASARRREDAGSRPAKRRAERGSPTLPLGLFGASTGGAAALVAAAARPDTVRAVVSRGGRPDLAGPALAQVTAPTLLIVGEHDATVADLNQQARGVMTAPTELRIVPGASHLFEEPGTLEEVAVQAADWFTGTLPDS